MADKDGKSRKNDKSKSRRKCVNFYKKFIFTPFPGRKVATNYSPTPSRSLTNVLKLPSKVAPATLAEWKSGTGSQKGQQNRHKLVFDPPKDPSWGQKRISP